jgi:hypothetical protein
MQSRKMAFIETWASTLIGLLVTLVLQFTLYPLYGIKIPTSINFQIVAWFTLASILRGYSVRRLFNWIHMRIKK